MDRFLVCVATSRHKQIVESRAVRCKQGSARSTLAARPAECYSPAASDPFCVLRVFPRSLLRLGVYNYARPGEQRSFLLFVNVACGRWCPDADVLQRFVNAMADWENTKERNWKTSEALNKPLTEVRIVTSLSSHSQLPLLSFAAV